MSTMSNKKKVLSVVVGVIALLVVAGGTVFILSKLNVERPEKNNTAASSRASANDIISGLQAKAPAALAGLSSQVAPKGQFKITAKLSDKNFTVAIPADEVLVFTAKDKSGITEAAPLLADAKQYFEGKGLNGTATSSTSASYENQVTLCQVQVQTGEPGAVVFGCSANSAVAKEYDAIAGLIKLYNQASPGKAVDETSLSSAARTIRQKDTVEGVTLSLLSGSKETSSGKVLLFGAVSGNWQYVADLTTGTSSGKANVPDEAVPLIKDKKWNGVLAGLVGLE